MDRDLTKSGGQGSDRPFSETAPNTLPMFLDPVKRVMREEWSFQLTEEEKPIDGEWTFSVSLLK